MRFSLALCLLLAWQPAAGAQPDARITYLSRQLKAGQDARVRAQAALVLGQSGESEARPPLCAALADSSEVVRGAAARALEQLGEVEALGCLAQARRDANGEVREAVGRAITTLEQARDRKPWLYIALQPVKVPSPLEAALGPLAEGRLKRHLLQLGTRWAPANESRTAARGVLKAQGLQGFVLVPELQAMGDKGMRMKLLCLSYPEQSLLGEIEVKASGGKPADLVKALAPRAVAEVAHLFEESRK